MSRFCGNIGSTGTLFCLVLHIFGRPLITSCLNIAFITPSLVFMRQQKTVSYVIRNFVKEFFTMEYVPMLTMSDWGKFVGTM